MGSLLGLMARIEVLAEGAQALPPETVVVRQPFLRLAERLRRQMIVALASVPTLGDQPRIQQNAQVLRDSRTAHAKVAREVVDRALSLGQQVENLAPYRMGNRRKDIWMRVVFHASMIRK